MSNRIFTEEQINGLLKNIHVSSCSDRYVVFTKDFKLLAIKQYEQGLMPTEIFRDAGFDPNLIGRKQPKECVSRWLEIFRVKGKDGLSDQRGKSGHGGRPRTKGITEADKIERLEAEIAYLKLENDFLAKLRAKRAESNSGRRKNILS